MLTLLPINAGSKDVATEERQERYVKAFQLHCCALSAKRKFLPAKRNLTSKGLVSFSFLNF